MTNKTKGWSAARRAKQAENMRKTKPWARSTGPKTERGKACTRQNALKHGHYSADMQTLRALLRTQKAFVKRALGSTFPLKNASRNHD